MVMDRIEGLIQRYFEEELGRIPGGRRDPLYPGAEDVYRYLGDALEGAELERMLQFLRGNKEGQELVLRARQIISEENTGKDEKVPAPLLAKAKALMGAARQAACPHCGRPVTPFRRPPAVQKAWNLAWLIVAAAAFGLSFVFPRYFMQLLLVSGLAGVKAIVDMKATRTQIMVYKALSQDAESGHLHTPSSRL